MMQIGTKLSDLGLQNCMSSEGHLSASNLDVIAQCNYAGAPIEVRPEGLCSAFACGAHAIPLASASPQELTAPTPPQYNNGLGM